jgi:Protein of unknown function (DUF433)
MEPVGQLRGKIRESGAALDWLRGKDLNLRPLGFLPTGWKLAEFVSLGWPDSERSSIIETEMTAEQKSALAGVVTIDKEVMHGTPCFARTRVPVQTLIDFLETGETIDDFLAV